MKAHLMYRDWDFNPRQAPPPQHEAVVQDDEYFATIQYHLKQLRFQHGVLISAELGEGNKGINYVLRKPNPRDGSWLDRLFMPGPPSYSYRLPERDEAGTRASSFPNPTIRRFSTSLLILYTLTSISSLVARVARAVQHALQPPGLSLVQANGPAANQTVPHLHIHVLPRRSDDGLLLNWSRTAEGDPAGIAEIAEQIRRHLRP